MLRRSTPLPFAVTLCPALRERSTTNPASGVVTLCVTPRKRGSTRGLESSRPAGREDGAESGALSRASKNEVEGCTLSPACDSKMEIPDS